MKCVGLHMECQAVNIPPNYIAKMLTPTGYADQVYPPGQVDIGDLSNTKQGNSLVMIQRSGFETKESFVEKDTDGADHRCMTSDGNPLAIDVRFIFALPDYTTEQGKVALNTLFLLGNPVPTKESRVLEISAESIYKQQAQQFVRGYIRRVCSGYSDFNTMFRAFANGTLTSDITSAVAKILVDQGVTFRLVSVEVSNMKPDETIVRAQLAQKEAEARNGSVDTVASFLAADKTGTRLQVWKMQQLREIVNAANTNGHNTIILTDGVTSVPVK